MATIPQVLALADAVPARYRYRAFILAATWSSARWGKLVPLTRNRLALLHGTMTVDRQFLELRGCRLQPDSRSQPPASGRFICRRICCRSYSTIWARSCRRTACTCFRTRRASPSSAARSAAFGCAHAPRPTPHSEVSRSASHGQHARRCNGCEHPRTNGADGPLFHARGADLSARDEGP